MRGVIRETKSVFKEYLQTKNESGGAAVSVFKVYKLFILKEKTIYTYLNMLHQNPTNEAVLMGLVWSPKYFNFAEKVEAIINEKGLSGFTYEKGPDTIKGLTKPTLFRNNDFTMAF